VTAGVASRLIDPVSGAEVVRVALAQRFLLRDQLITPDGTPLTKRFSDILLLGSTSIVPNWTFDTALRYNPDIDRSARSIVGLRYSPGPFRTIGATYRYARGLSEQLDMGWQWPIYRSAATSSRLLAPGGGQQGCAGTWYSVGRMNYSMRDSRITDSLLGLEYDAGCWIGRVVAERLSTGRSEATTRLMVQLELVGLSRLGIYPLAVLKDNIPGYRLLRDDPDALEAAPTAP
jgi:LPS-assembly protein